MAFGRYLVELREKHGVSRRRLNEMTGLSLSYLHEIEKGNYLPGPENLRKIAVALGEDPEQLLRERDRVQFERLGLDPELSLLLKEAGELSDDERSTLLRTYRNVLARRRTR
jgi:transcriptional regulator with XRE-family HTH domain